MSENDRFWTPRDAPSDTRPQTLFKRAVLSHPRTGPPHDRVLTTIGYARVSTADQSLDMQLNALDAAGCTRIYRDTTSSALDSRPGLAEALDAVAAGDTLVVWRLDRLGRSLAHLVTTVDGLGARGVSLRSLHEQIDASTATGRLTFGIFASLAAFERELAAERTAAGLAVARRRGTRLGRPGVWSDEKDAAARVILAGGRAWPPWLVPSGYREPPSTGTHRRCGGTRAWWVGPMMDRAEARDQARWMQW